MIPDETADRIAHLLLTTFGSYTGEFQEITRRARHKFEERDWKGRRKDALERLDLYDRYLEQTAAAIGQIAGGRLREKDLWIAAKHQFSANIAGRSDEDVAETFFSSVTRKMLSTVGIDRDVEFFHLHPKPRSTRSGESIYRSYVKNEEIAPIIKKMLGDFQFHISFENLERDAQLVSREIDLYLWPLIRNHQQYVVDVITSPFFRNKGAYIIGRIVTDLWTIPLIIPLANGDRGIYVDTVLLHQSEASVVFSFAYSYFHVEIPDHSALIDFLKVILPQKDIAEMYASIGYTRHGKTEFYRDLHRFVHVAREQFVIAPGREGAVMCVFTLPGYNFVFKVIKDRPCFVRSAVGTPKGITKPEVKSRYASIARRDRAGRLVDTHEFENLKFKKKRFSEELLKEFALVANDSISIEGEYVVLKHLYVQRKVLPLPMYFDSETNPESLRSVLIDFGYFLKDLAAIGVFPGDLFNVWNYGVTQRGRVVLFDYDDVVPLEEINFLEKTHPRNEYEEMSAEEDWVVAGPDDFFMDEIDRYSGIPYPLKGIFKSVHGDLYTLAFWNEMKARVKEGEIVDVIPYDRLKRFHQSDRLM